MGKSSTSHKKRRSKKSSKVRTSGKSKRRRYTAKKLRRRHEESVSISDYSDSTSSDSSLSSSSENSYRSRRARSSKRKDEKVRRKMAKRHSYRHERSDDSYHDRKRKRAKRKNEQEVREKPYKKKKLRKEASLSSMSNGSLSCSTCHGESARSDDGEHERNRGNVERKEKERRGLDRGRSGSERGSRYRARSCSSCSFSSKSGDEWTEVKYVSKNNSSWLRSVITVAKGAEEARELCQNETKEEIVDDHDYPCRSNDSNDGGSKRESEHHSLPASKESVEIEDKEVDRIVDSKLTESDRFYNNRSQYDAIKLDVYGAGTSESVERKTNETSGASLNGDDLESILRRRALENLRKFCGEIQSSAKASSQKIRIDNDVIQPPIEKFELVQGKSTVNNAGAGENFDNITHVEDINLPTGRRNSVASSNDNEKNLNGGKGKSVSLKHHSTCAPEKVIDAENPSEVITTSSSYISNNPELNAPESFHHSLKSHPSLKQTPASGHEKSAVTESTIDKHATDTVHIVSHSSSDDVKNIKELCSPTSKSSREHDEDKDDSRFELKQTSDSHELHHVKCPLTGKNVDQNAAKTDAANQNGSTSGIDVDKPCVSAIAKPCSERSLVDNSSTNLQGEASQGSQFEQKTMNVMRGGEMVQVSYKVYIPKKTPALARRQLKR